VSDYKVSEGAFWKPTKREEFVEGLYINKETEVGENKSNIYYIEQLFNHEVVQLWGTTILDQRMAPVRVGQQVRITYKGLGEKGKGGKQAPHIWKVEYKNPDYSSSDIADDVDAAIK
jgi:hypothetical protein